MVMDTKFSYIRAVFQNLVLLISCSLIFFFSVLDKDVYTDDIDLEQLPYLKATEV